MATLEWAGLLESVYIILIHSDGFFLGTVKKMLKSHPEKILEA